MAGRPKVAGEENRTERTSVRWTKSELGRLEKTQKIMGVTYLTDVPRIMALRQITLEEAFGNRLEGFKRRLDVGTTGEVIEALVNRQIDLEDPEKVLRSVNLEKSLGNKTECLEQAREAVGASSMEEAIGILVARQLDSMDRRGTLQSLNLEKSLGDRAEDLRKLQEVLGAESMEELVGMLVIRQLELMSSALEKHVAQ